VREIRVDFGNLKIAIGHLGNFGTELEGVPLSSRLGVYNTSDSARFLSTVTIS
jgi:hypothetical protein